MGKYTVRAKALRAPLSPQDSDQLPDPNNSAGIPNNGTPPEPERSSRVHNQELPPKSEPRFSLRKRANKESMYANLRKDFEVDVFQESNKKWNIRENYWQLLRLKREQNKQSWADHDESFRNSSSKHLRTGFQGTSGPSIDNMDSEAAKALRESRSEELLRFIKEERKREDARRKRQKFLEHKLETLVSIRNKDNKINHGRSSMEVKGSINQQQQFAQDNNQSQNDPKRGSADRLNSKMGSEKSATNVLEYERLTAAQKFRLLNPKFQLNRIFKDVETELSDKQAAYIKLDVNFKDFKTAEFSNHFGQFDAVIVSESITKILHLQMEKLSEKGMLFVWVRRGEDSLAYSYFSKWGYDVIDHLVWAKTQSIIKKTEEGEEIVGEKFVQSKMQRGGGLFFDSYERCFVGYKCPPGQPVGYRTKVSNNLMFGPADKGPPEHLYHIVNSMLPGGKKLEMFSRGFRSHGWLSLVRKDQETLTGQVQNQNSRMEIENEVGAEEEEKKMKYHYQIHNIKCSFCQRQPIYECYFECKRCKDFKVCQNCLFNQKAPHSHVPGDHRWVMKSQCLNEKTRNNVRECFHCNAQICKQDKHYVCENCCNVYVCLECRDSVLVSSSTSDGQEINNNTYSTSSANDASTGTDKLLFRGDHSHNILHNLTLSL